jgi:hypothetical protein
MIQPPGVGAIYLSEILEKIPGNLKIISYVIVYQLFIAFPLLFFGRIARANRGKTVMLVVKNIVKD